MVAAIPVQRVAEPGEFSPSDRGKGAASLKQYEDAGIIHVPGVFSREEAAEMAKLFTEHVESGDSTLNDKSNVFKDGDILQRYPRFMHPHRHPEAPAGVMARKMMMDPRVVEVVEHIIGPAYGAQSMFYFKPPTARGQALHQDNFFLQAHPETCLAAWVAADDADGDNGGLRIIPGSHKNEILCHDQADMTKSFSPNQIVLPNDFDPEPRLIQTELKAGDVLFFHGSLVHGSLPNTSDRFRRVGLPLIEGCRAGPTTDPQALILHYIPQASTEVCKHYLPCVELDGGWNDVEIPGTERGGPCGFLSGGEAFRPVAITA